MDPLLRVALTVGLVAGAGSHAEAQRPSTSSKDHSSFRKIFAPACEVASRATLRVRGDGRVRALACVVSRDGLALTKASELRSARKIECEFADGKRFVATRGPVDEECDLLLLDFRHAVEHGQVRKRAMVELRFDVATAEIGSFIACAGVDTTPMSVGVVSLAPYVRADRASRRGSLELPFADDRREARIEGVEEDTAASRAGLEDGDVIESVDTRAVSGPRSFARAIRRKRPGTQITLEVRRGEDVLEVPMRVERSRDRFGRRDPQQPLWGELSRVRLGFPKVLQHDAVIKPRDCGGVLVDLDGRILGINIARVGRVETHALPSAIVKKRLERLLERVQQ